MKKKIGLIAVMAALLVLVYFCQLAGDMLWDSAARERETAAAGSAKEGTRLVVVDPGHGGIDAGKVGINGVEEKEINLKISLKIKEILNKEKVDVILTRESDERLADTQVSDLKERVSIMNNQKPVLAVSIHQNSYHEESVSGSQVFYYTDSTEGKQAAEILQRCLKELDPENAKNAAANNTYYILKKTEVPVVIVECGFLSNYSEAEKLAEEAYQQSLAEAVSKGILQYIQ